MDYYGEGVENAFLDLEERLTPRMVIMQEGLNSNEDLTRIVNEHVDYEQLNGPHEGVINNSDWTPQQMIAFTWEATSAHQELFERAQAVIPDSKRGLRLRIPEEIQSWQIAETLATARVVYEHSSTIDGLYEDNIALKKVGNEWFIDSPQVDTP